MRADVPQPVSIDEAFASTTFLADRSPATTSAHHFATVTQYRDGGVYVANYAGSSEWERHPVGDELVTVVAGSTTMTLLIDGVEVAHTMGPGDLIVVPRNTWHRFDTPEGVRVMTVTPQPGDHWNGDGLPPAHDL